MKSSKTTCFITDGKILNGRQKLVHQVLCAFVKNPTSLPVTITVNQKFNHPNFGKMCSKIAEKHSYSRFGVLTNETSLGYYESRQSVLAEIRLAEPENVSELPFIPSTDEEIDARRKIVIEYNLLEDFRCNDIHRLTDEQSLMLDNFRNLDTASQEIHYNKIRESFFNY